jgi:hypothetical protein
MRERAVHDIHAELDEAYDVQGRGHAADVPRFILGELRYHRGDQRVSRRPRGLARAEGRSVRSDVGVEFKGVS